MRVLLIAPENKDLPGEDSEIAAINSFHDVTNIVGIVRETDIAQAISDNPQGFDIFWILSHAGDLGVKLSDQVLTADGVGQFLSASRARLCVLNACSSEALARQIIVGTDSDLIYTISDVLDADALRFGTLLAGELAKTDNFRKAFDLASPKRGRYKYLAAKAAIRSLESTHIQFSPNDAHFTQPGVYTLTEVLGQMKEQTNEQARQMAQMWHKLILIEQDLVTLKDAETKRLAHDSQQQTRAEHQREMALILLFRILTVVALIAIIALLLKQG